MNNVIILSLAILLLSIAHAQTISPLINISNTTEIIDREPALAIDSKNIIHAVWRGFYYQPGAQYNVASDIFYSNNRGGSFSTPVKYSVPEEIPDSFYYPDPLWHSSVPVIAVDRNDNIHIVFGRMHDQTTATFGERLYYLLIRNDGISQGPERIAGGYWESNPNPFSQSIFIDRNNEPVITYGELPSQGHESIHFFRNRDWNNVNIAATDTFLTAHASYLDRDDHLHFVYRARRHDNSPGVHDALFYINNVTGIFTSPYRITPDTLAISGFSMALDSTGYVHIIYQVVRNIRFGGIVPYQACYINNRDGQFRNVYEFDETMISPLTIFAGNAYDVHIFERTKYHYTSNGVFTSKYISLPGMDISNRRIFFKNKNEILFAFSDWVGTEYESDAEIYYFTISNPITNIENFNQGKPHSFSLYQNYPNPFNPGTTIIFGLPSDSPVSLKVFDLLGREIAILMNKTLTAGTYEMKFDGSSLASGIYFYRLQAGAFSETRKFVLQK